VSTSRAASLRPVRRARTVVTALVAALLAGCSQRACGRSDSRQEKAAFEEEHASLVTRNRADATFVVHTEGDRKRFAKGETITLVLAFSSASQAKYTVDIGTWDNSGRLESETFRFDPATVIDPLEHYFEGGRTGGGTRPRPPVLGDRPTEVKIALNEWARFDTPGTYRLFVQSSRIEGNMMPKATSNVLELEIADDPAFAQAELERARSVLDTRQSTDEAKNEARRSLRFLGTSGAAQRLVDDLCRGDAFGPFQTELGLFASPFRSEVVTLLSGGLVAHDCAINASYLRLLARLQRNDAGRRDAAERKFLAGLEQKQGRAAGISILTALAVIDEHEKRDGKPDPMREGLRARIAGVLTTLPEEALARMLADDWTKVRSPAMAPALLALVKEARPRGGQLRSISDLALERLLEVDHDGARAFILSELARPEGVRLSFAGKTLGLLEDKELPRLDAALLSGVDAEQHDGATLELRAEVLARYASKAILDKVWPRYRASSYFRVSLLSYLWRNDPKGAEAEMRTIDDAESLRRLSLQMWSASLEALVVRRLKARDASTAAALLADRGSASAETALVDRWRELHASGDDKDGLAQTLRGAILRGRAWMVTPEKMRTLAELCDDPMCKGDLTSPAGRWGAGGKRPDLVVWSHPDGTVTGWFGHYTVTTTDDVETRVKQLPAGYTIALGTKPPDVDAALLDKVRAWAAAKGSAIVVAP
jgi:hypothetical protein